MAILRLSYAGQLYVVLKFEIDYNSAFHFWQLLITYRGGIIMNGKKPLLSVIVPVYNAEKYIEECVESILRQTYMAIEVILINDGSSDRSGLICDLLAEKNSCIKVLHVENRGIIKARLIGARVSVAEWVTFVDADDWIEENAYENLIGCNDCDMVITGICRYFDRNHREMQMPYLREGLYSKCELDREIIPVMLWNSRQRTWALDPSLCTKIFKRRILLQHMENASDVGSNYGEDSCVIFPMMLVVQRIRIIRKVYYYHRQRTSGIIPPYIQDEEFIPKLNKVYEYLKMRFKETIYWDILKNRLDCFFISSVELIKRRYKYPMLEFAIFFPVDKIAPRSKVVLFGAGEMGKRYWKQNMLYHFCNIVLWVDSKYDVLDRFPIRNPETIRELTFDYILIAVDNYYT